MFDTSDFRLILDHVSDGVYLLDRQRTILQWNRSAERLTGYSAGEVVGRSCKDNILVHMDDKGSCLCTGECPVQATLQDGQTRQAEVFLHHKDGYRVPVRVTVSPIRDEAGEIVAAVETFQENSVIIGMRSCIERLKHWAVIDLETGLTNRRSTEMRLQMCLDECKRFGWPFGIVLAEIDFYSTLQRELAPDMLVRVRRMVGRSVMNSLRSLDTVGRWGDAEFLAIVSNVEPADLQAICDRTRMVVQASFLHGQDGPVRATVSIGAAVAEEADTVPTLLRRAEMCLLESRGAGRNRATVAGAQSQI